MIKSHVTCTLFFVGGFFLGVALTGDPETEKARVWWKSQYWDLKRICKDAIDTGEACGHQLREAERQRKDYKCRWEAAEFKAGPCYREAAEFEASSYYRGAYGNH